MSFRDGVVDSKKVTLVFEAVAKQRINDLLPLRSVARDAQFDIRLRRMKQTKSLDELQRPFQMGPLLAPSSAPIASLSVAPTVRPGSTAADFSSQTLPIEPEQTRAG